MVSVIKKEIDKILNLAEKKKMILQRKKHLIFLYVLCIVIRL